MNVIRQKLYNILLHILYSKILEIPAQDAAEFPPK